MGLRPTHEDEKHAYQETMGHPQFAAGGRELLCLRLRPNLHPVRVE